MSLPQAGEQDLGGRLVSLMCFCEYVGNGVKDLVCAPRPMGHPKGSQTKLLLAEKGGRDDANVHSLVRPYLSRQKASFWKGTSGRIGHCVLHCT